MAEQPITELYPQANRQCELEGLYLAHDLRQYASAPGQVYIYANFVTSLDGRIAIPRPDGAGLMVPKNTANPRDWRLYQELCAQADVLLTTGRYLRDLDAGIAQPLAQLHKPEFADLKAWRVERGLKPYPDTAIISDSLNFDIPDSLRRDGRQVLVLTHRYPRKDVVKKFEGQGAKVVAAGDNRVEGGELRERLAAQGYHTVYSAAGPKVHRTLLAAGALDRLYLTTTFRILGGDPFASIVDGALLEPAVDAHLEVLYHDPYALDGLGQLFAGYTIRKSG